MIDMSTSKDKVWATWEKGQSDPEYIRMLAELKGIEARYDQVLGGLPSEQQDAICDFVSQCEAMSWRLLEIACEK